MHALKTRADRGGGTKHGATEDRTRSHVGTGAPGTRGASHPGILPALAAVIASGALACLPAHAAAAGAEQRQPETLQNSRISARLLLRGGHVEGLQVTDLRSQRTIVVNSPFELTLQGGTTLQASAMSAEAEAATSLQPDAAATEGAMHEGGKQICANLRAAGLAAQVRWCLVLREQSRYLRETLDIQALHTPLNLQTVHMLGVSDPAAQVSGTVAGSPVVDGTAFFGIEHPLATSAVHKGEIELSMQRSLPLQTGQRVTYSAVMGLSDPGQMRRSFLTYLERERAHPYRTFLTYNTWFDLGYGNRYTAAGAIDRVNAFGRELVQKRSVKLDSYLFDDGWDNPNTLWQFNAGFPQGFTPVSQAAKQYGAGIGVWLSPWGGYDEAKKERIAYGRAHGYEIVKNGYALSGPRYYRAFSQTCSRMVRQYGVNQFKFDGTGNADQVFPGSLFDSDFDAAIHLIDGLRGEEPSIFINLTTGTYPSPWWLRYADSIWRGGDDDAFAGVGSWRQRWMTYRDGQVYRNIVQGGPLFPLNSLMLHGIIYAKQAEHLADDPGHDFADEVWSFFGSGTDLQELYMTPSLLRSADWDVLADAAKWSRNNSAVLRDTHWIGGDPNALAIYGWASWTPQKSILVLRNPSAQAQSFRLDAQTALQLPRGAARQFRVVTRWRSAGQSAGPSRLDAGNVQPVPLEPFGVLVMEATPQP